MIQKTFDYGIEYQFGNKIIFFGNAQFQENDLPTCYPQFEYLKIKQVHGEVIVPHAPSSSENPPMIEADGHFTQQCHLALRILTADCLPIFIADSVNDRILALHAGWRGVEKRIAPKGVRLLLDHGGRVENFQVFIGPHIRRASFEVDEPVWTLLKKTIPSLDHSKEKLFCEMIKNNKYLVDLEAIVVAQLDELGLKAPQIISLNVDTLKDPHWHSYRRDGAQAGRNVSFIAQLNQVTRPSY